MNTTQTAGKTIGRKTGRKTADSATIGRNAENHNLANYALINKLANYTSRRIAGKCQKNKIGRNHKTATSLIIDSKIIPSRCEVASSLRYTALLPMTGLLWFENHTDWVCIEQNTPNTLTPFGTRSRRIAGKVQTPS
jgi:hypothetical protein